MLAVGPEYGFGLYIHWPYCTRICPYCDFNVYAAKDRETEPLLEAVLSDLRAHRARLPEHPNLQSIFLGGGTPSLLPARDLASIIDTANDLFGLEADAEITLEANPNNVFSHTPPDWTAAGINRLSIGVQSFDDKALNFLGRDHDTTIARKAITYAEQSFENYSIDLIYARPGQSPEAWADELTTALDLGAPHLSLYELTIEERTAFGKRAARGELLPMPDDDQADLYEITQEICEQRGLPAYEVSNHARSDAHESRHNHIYWASGDWIGVGPGAHGRLTRDQTRYATEAERRPVDYIKHTGTALAPLSEREAAHEYLAMALRPVAGLDLNRFERVFGTAPSAHTIETLVDNGHAQIEGSRLKLTRDGRLVADYIASLLAPY
ncbi:MAG: radical SAM family heme chaperone HemW [Pseudomonadota bacterium]